MRVLDYELAERRICSLLEGGSYRPHEVVERLSVDQAPDVVSTAMWTLVGDGTLELSDDWYISLS